MNRTFVSTHSRPKAAGLIASATCARCRGFNSQPPEGGWGNCMDLNSYLLTFQLTAARRRLGELCIIDHKNSKFQLTAARRRLAHHVLDNILPLGFQLTAARRRLAPGWMIANNEMLFQLTAARRRLGRRPSRPSR